MVQCIVLTQAFFAKGVCNNLLFISAAVSDSL